MKLADLEDGAQIVTKEYLDTKLERLQNTFDHRFNQFDARINRVERTVWLAIAASIAQIVTVITK
jgi:hypothetical protein